LLSGRGPHGREFLPERHVSRQLSGRVLFLKRFQLAPQLSQRKRQPELGYDKKRLDKKDGGKKGGDPGKKQRQPQAWPSFPSGIGKDEGGALLREIGVHQVFAAHILAGSSENAKTGPAARAITQGVKGSAPIAITSKTTGADLKLAHV